MEIFDRVNEAAAEPDLHQVNYEHDNSGSGSPSRKEENCSTNFRKRMRSRDLDCEQKRSARRWTCSSIWEEETMGDQREHTAKTDFEKLEDDRKKLPVYPCRESLLQTIHDNQVVIITGGTGSGKSTQIPQYLHEAGYTNRGKIVCTQPHRVAVMSAAARVAQEMGVNLGEEVGYSVRFENLTSDKTVLKHMTDEMLLRELFLEPDLASYSVVMVDEAHERSLSTDVLLSLVKDIAQHRPDFKVLISGVTSMKTASFRAYFHSAPIFRIPGRLYPVGIRYHSTEPRTNNYMFDPKANFYLDAVIDVAFQIHESRGDGDILVFLQAQNDIATVEERLKRKTRDSEKISLELIICPIYADLPAELLANIFAPTPKGARKVVLATNIAETSLSINGIKYVIDPRFYETKSYNFRTGMESLRLTKVSKASASQRAYRSGQTGPGTCYRLYKRHVYNNVMRANDDLEIKRCNLANVVLTLKCLGVQDLSNFDFMDRPSNKVLIKALGFMNALGALDSQGELTKVGKKMAEFPLDPMLSRMIVASDKYKCSSEIITIVAMLSVGESVYHHPDDKRGDAAIARERFHTGNVGDHIGLLNVYNSWKETNFSTQWCDENYVQVRSMKRARNIRDQLESLLTRAEIEVTSNKNDLEAIKKAIISGCFPHLARFQEKASYLTVESSQIVHIHLSSSYVKFGTVLPRWVVYHQLTAKSKKYMHLVTELELEWLVEVASDFYELKEVEK